VNVATIEIEQEKAKEYLASYTEAVRTKRHEERLAEDEMMVQAFKAAAKGQQLIHLTDTIRNGGVDDNGLPRLAICRAHAEWVYIERERDGRVVFAETPNPAHNARFSVRQLQPGTLPEGPWVHWWDRWRAMVPNVPPHLRPKFQFHNYHVLWEAEWGRAPRPPSDPYLLKHVGGDLYAVLAAWDLTEVERAVLAHRS
jgi:hypothetical protein